MKFSVSQLSRRGGREKNEDRMGYCYTRESGLFLVADGMGGHPDGEVAAQIAVQTISALFQSQAKPLLDDVPEFLASALFATHQQILSHAMGRGMNDTPRTTLVAAVLQAGSATWIHCGDSRLYIVRDGALLTRTRDHSYMELRKTVPRYEFGNINRNVLFTCLGAPFTPIYDVAGPMQLQSGDRMLLCSDGLWGALGDEDITRQLARGMVSHAVPELVEMALQRAGSNSDNVSVVALEWDAPDAVEPMQLPTGGASEDMFISTIQADPSDACLDDPDDAVVERSIAEINEAIRRSGARKE
ncbi:serine/threonine-protein phosphatase [Verminephrobacter aporrectodeae subsp. tuberculatae]|uniref:PP2C family protein-serine/threonine phosphatase n=1 Tax=Verminephrobacter aporrectodeae TaxID=1110389 RepID=UPI002238725D|nr:protein phosphatase 2C domain-containing protein [Verminephrobacter aporrectodeae]MCW5255595.1 serine/threonine-protein phosphatase [Verminephrobacter aporrectodeae subsp. tuberculatae]